MDDDARELFDFGSDLFTLDDVSAFHWPADADHVPIKDDAEASAAIPLEPTPADANASQGQGDATASRPSPQTAQPRKQPIKNRGRERLKQEMEELRRCALQLEQELQTLQAAKRSVSGDHDHDHDRASGSGAGSGTGSTVSSSSSNSSSQSLVRRRPWEITAETERSKRQRSEQENERLRRTLETQLRLATGLSAYLSSRVSRQGTSATGVELADVVTHIPPLFFSSFNFVTAQLLRDVDRAYAVTDQLFSRSAWESYPDERVFESTVKTRRYKGEEQLYVELNDTAYRPHSYERVVAAVWEATQSVYGTHQRNPEISEFTQDAIKIRYRRLGRTRRGEDKELVVTAVIKRFVEPDRTVDIWRACITPAGHDVDMPIQALSDETGWAIVTRVPEGCPTREAGTAFSQVTSHLVPLWFENDVVDFSVRTQLTIGEFTNVALSVTEADYVSFEDVFQRLVLKDVETVVVPLEDTRSELATASV